VKRKNKKIKRLKQEALKIIVLNRCIQKENDLLKEKSQKIQEEIRKLQSKNRKM
jgi:G:T-mismatch repair DNA endonuclease (very short patch repair protein)